MIEVRGLGVRLGGGRVLDGVGFSLAPREILGLIGPPEAGKTTLLKAIAALVDPCEGEIRAGGARVDRLPEQARAAWQRRIGMAFQNDALFDALSVFDNVAFPLRRRRVAEEELAARVELRLADVGLLEARDLLPGQISGGMRKRVGIARAAVLEPEVGLFDDPVAGLDPVSASRTLELIVHLSESLGMATVVASNDLPVLLPVCHRVLMLHAGAVAFDGPPDDLTRSPRPEVVQFVTGAEEGPL